MNAHRDEDETWSTCLEEQYSYQVVTIQLFHRGPFPFKRRELLGTGNLSVSGNQVPTSFLLR